MRGLLLGLLAALCLAASGCSHTAGRIALTPVTVVRDVVDAPVVTVTNVFEYFADQSRLARAPSAGAGWSLFGGFNLGIGYDFSWLLFKGLSGVFGSVDYLVCRSLWPNWPAGVSPWLSEGQGWGSLYFPNTRVLWGDDGPLYTPPRAEPPPPAAPR
ncbi:MAG: hypothetical protein SF028_03625 [Candidatus Sumerlaeia bacterium]|nr:hypothetical protein [Candidatus Sumerlaeia bacterium]